MEKLTEHDYYFRGLRNRMVVGMAIAGAVCFMQLLASCEQEPTDPAGKTHNDTTENKGGIKPDKKPWNEGWKGETTAIPEEETKERDNDTTNVPEEEELNNDNDTTDQDYNGEIIDPRM